MKPKVLNSSNNAEGCTFVEDFTFWTKHKVPLYDISTMGAFNQLVGFAKFTNSEYGNVYYRGIGGLYDNVLPSLLRNRRKGIPDDLTAMLKKISKDTRLNDSLKLRPINSKAYTKQDYRSNKIVERFNKYTIESLLQHYVGYTRFLDVVDNHWIALWMGLHTFKMHGKGLKFCDCIKRSVPLCDYFEGIMKGIDNSKTAPIYVYVLLIAMPHAQGQPHYGITETDKLVEVDLRKALPSIYLRPHSQHALVIRKRDKQNINAEASYYDMSSQVVGILRIRVDRADMWLGNGTLMTKDNIFHSPSIDQGYNTLLMRTDIFTYPLEIIKYY